MTCSQSRTLFYILRLQKKLLKYETQKTQTPTCVQHVFVVTLFSPIFLLFPFLFSTRRCFLSKRESNKLRKRLSVARLHATEKARKKLHTTLDTTYFIACLIFVRKKAKTLVPINATFHNVQ